jgi:hypothetical protein
MSSNVKIVAALLGCVALALLWFSRGEDPAAPEVQREGGQPSMATKDKPKRRMLLDQPMARDELDDAGSHRPGMLKSQLEARAKKVKQRREAMKNAPATPDEAEDDQTLDHWRNIVLNDPDPDERADALTQLDYDEPDAMAVLVQALQDRDVDVRLSALDELWVNADEPPLDLLAPVLNDPDAEVRAEAVRMIAESDDPEAAALLETALSDADEDVRSEAADALDIDEEDLEALP